MFPSKSRGHTQTGRRPSTTIDLILGAPGPDLLPTRLIQASTQLALSDDSTWAGQKSDDEIIPTEALLYGPMEGDVTVREALADLLSRESRLTSSSSFATVDPSHIMLTSGASTTLALLLSTFTQAKGITKRVFTSNATYFCAFGIIRDAGYTFPADAEATGQTADVEGISEDAEGIDVDALEERLSQLDSEYLSGAADISQDRKRFRYALYLVPTFSNPTGTVLSAARREKLVKLAAKHDILVICDDVYEYLYDPSVGGLPPLRLVAVDRAVSEGKNVISNCTFSKLLAPGTRLGWIECHPQLITQLLKNGALFSGGGFAHLSSRLVLPLLLPSALPYLQKDLPALTDIKVGHSALEHHIDQIRRAYGRRRAALFEAIRENLLPLGFNLSLGEPLGGYFVWLELPNDISEKNFVRECAKVEVIVGPGSNFVVSRDEGGKATIRLCWAWHKEDRLKEGVQRIGKIVHSLQR
ncbi:hypothetical protein M422DRAFT_259967 [Sphaerobolus stellatus SS14]|uniref:Aminotransferase class I/classII large domain-containing protein n=1 Tax=Sphaerobolus stellatus (strain SS14) TaxID=990650 RepID=A0A0C9V7Q6_SPHS4|nr:hypothetical protein M422DRAFT_259967 [Sphaerobolus stellatus SS14]